MPAGATKAEPVETEMAADGKQGPLNDLVVRFTGPGAVIASGHSRGGTLPQNAGLMRSPDAGKTWESISGLGEIDYHDIEVAGDAGDRAARRPARRAGEQRRRQDVRGLAAPAVARAVDITINPADAKQWAVGTEQGVFLSGNSGGSWRQRETTFGARVAWAAPDALYSAGLDGKVRKSADGGKNLGGGRHDRRRPQGLRRRARTASSTPTSPVARSAAPRTAARPGPTSSPCSDGPPASAATPTLGTWRFIAASTPPILAASVSGASTKSAGSARG